MEKFVRTTKTKRLNNLLDINCFIKTMDFTNPAVIIFEGNCYVTPTFEDESYTDVINQIRQQMKKSSYKFIYDNLEKFDKRKYIFDLYFPDDKIKIGKKKYITFSLFLKQNEPYDSFKDIINEIDFNPLLRGYHKILTDNGFEVGK